MQIARMKQLLFFTSFILFFFLLALIPFGKSFVFIDNDSNKVAGYLPMDNPSFQIKYIHSIHLSEVLESYRVLPDKQLKMVELEYEDFNIGMPSNAGEGEEFVEKDGKYIIRNMERTLPEFRLFVGDVETGLYFVADEEEFDLKETLERGKSYTFRVQHLSILERLKGVKLDEQ